MRRRSLIGRLIDTRGGRVLLVLAFVVTLAAILMLSLWANVVFIQWAVQQ